MAEPIIPDHYRAMVIMQNRNGLPEDRYINTWFFRGDGIGTHPAVHDNIISVLAAFYTGQAASGLSLAQYLSGALIGSVELRTYYLGDAVPREPIISAVPWNPVGAAASLPEEVAVCLSYETARRGPRGRGRLYLGPLVQDAVEMVGGHPRVKLGMRQAVAERADNVMNTTENVTWVQLSRVEATTNVVTGGWVDDAFDTQRRRGAAPTLREPFGSAVIPAI